MPMSGAMIIMVVCAITVNLPAVRDRMDDGHVSPAQQRVGVVVQVRAKVHRGEGPELGLNARRDAHHELDVQERLDPIALMVCRAGIKAASGERHNPDSEHAAGIKFASWLARHW